MMKPHKCLVLILQQVVIHHVKKWIGLIQNKYHVQVSRITCHVRSYHGDVMLCYGTSCYTMMSYGCACDMCDVSCIMYHIPYIIIVSQPLVFPLLMPMKMFPSTNYLYLISHRHQHRVWMIITLIVQQKPYVPLL